jgi:mono/diheme cytochrome c family protein
VRRAAACVAAGALVVALAACTAPFAGKTGDALYHQACAQCHGRDLSGGTGPAIGPGSNTDLNLSDRQIAGVIEVGPGSMPGFGDRLTLEQVDSLVTYVRSVQQGSEDS